MTEGGVDHVQAPVPAGTASRLAALRPWVGLVARLVLGGVFIVAGALKVGDTSASIRAVTAYDLLPVPVATIVGYGLPWLEICFGLLLVVGLLTRVSAIVLGLLLVAFIVGVGSAWARGLSIDCGCFGGGGQVSPDKTAYLAEIVRDVGLLVLAGWLAFWPATRFAIDTNHVIDSDHASDSGHHIDSDHEGAS